jgi:hypothetical protein
MPGDHAFATGDFAFQPAAARPSDRVKLGLHLARLSLSLAASCRLF